MTITKRNGKYYCRFQINGERHHYLCSGASSVKEAEKIENAFKYKLQQQQNGVIPKEDKKRYKLKALKENFLEYSKISKRKRTNTNCTRYYDTLRYKNYNVVHTCRFIGYGKRNECS